PLASSAPLAVRTVGLTSTTRSRPSALHSSSPPSVVPPTPRASFSRRSVLRPSSLTLPFVSVSVSSSSRTARRSLPS
ncbi:hypothetical protein BG005_005622, partial [Podila minutissima]